MTTVTTTQPTATSAPWLQNNNLLGFFFMLPAAVFLVCFLTYPLGLGVWLGFTDTRIGRDGIFIGLENYIFLARDKVFWLAVFNTLFYTLIASILIAARRDRRTNHRTKCDPAAWEQPAGSSLCRLRPE